MLEIYTKCFSKFRIKLKFDFWVPINAEFAKDPCLRGSLGDSKWFNA